jgi:hypothetical protein
MFDGDKWGTDSAFVADVLAAEECVRGEVACICNAECDISWWLGGRGLDVCDLVTESDLGSNDPIEPCAVVDRAACDDEDVTVKGVSDACFAAGGQIAGNLAACGACDPAIEGPADVCVECQQAVFGAFAQCDEKTEVGADAEGGNGGDGSPTMPLAVGGATLAATVVAMLM